MAIVRSGPMVGYSGTVGGMTYSQLKDGRTVVKSQNSPSSKPPTHQQLCNQQDLGVTARFVKLFKKFHQVSYRSIAEKIHDNTHNVMVSEIRKIGLEGEYPNRYVNLQTLPVSKGSLPCPADQSAALTNIGISFKWSSETKEGESHHSDQVMMLAFFPELEQIKCDTGGAKRSAGQDTLKLHGVKKGFTAEVYIAFISSDHQRVSNSKYLGHFNW